MLSGHLCTLVNRSTSRAGSECSLTSFHALADRMMDFFQNFSQTIAKFPGRVMLLKLSDIADPPDVVANPVRLLVALS
jgi:hypothetical protein